MTGFEIFFVISSIVAAMSGAYSIYQQGQAEKKASDYNAQVAENQAAWANYNAQREAGLAKQQAEWAEYNATLAETQAKEGAQRKEEDKQKLLSSQKARYGKSGLLLEGTPLDVMAVTMYEMDRDILGILHEGELEAYDWRKQAWQHNVAADSAIIEGANLSSVNKSRAALNTMKGAQAGRAGTYGAGTTILTGASKLAGKYYTPNTGMTTEEKSLLAGWG